MLKRRETLRAVADSLAEKVTSLTDAIKNAPNQIETFIEDGTSHYDLMSVAAEEKAISELVANERRLPIYKALLTKKRDELKAIDDNIDTFSSENQIGAIAKP